MEKFYTKTKRNNQQLDKRPDFTGCVQAEVDYYWAALTANGGEEGSCGWCKDKYGLSWQVVPVEYFDLINSEDPKVREKAMRNTLKQKKLILSELK